MRHVRSWPLPIWSSFFIASLGALDSASFTDAAGRSLAAEVATSVPNSKSLTTLRFGIPVRATKITVKPGQPDPYELLRRAHIILRSDDKRREEGGTVSELRKIACQQLSGGDREGALESLRAAEADARAATGDYVNTSGWSALGALFAAAGDRESALRLANLAVAEANARMIRPDSANQDSMELERVFHHLALLGDATLQRKLLAVERRVALNVARDFPQRGWILRNYGLRQLKFGDLSGALATAKLAAEIEKTYEAVELYLEVIRVQVEVGGDLKAAEETAKLVDPKQTDGEQFRPLMEAYAKRGNLPAAIALAERITWPGNRDAAWFAGAESLAQAGEWLVARACIDRIGNPTKRAEGLVALAVARIARGEADAALRTLAEVRPLLERPWTEEEDDDWSRKCELLAHATTLMVSSTASLPNAADHAAEARRMLVAAVDRTFQRADKPPFTCEWDLMEFVAVQCTIGDAAGARSTMRRIHESLIVILPDRKSLHLRSRARLLAKVAAVQRRLGDTAEADETFRQALDIARQQTANDYGRLERCESTLSVVGAAGPDAAKHIDALLAEVRRESQGRCPTSLLLEIADYRTRSSDWAGAEALLTEPGTKMFDGMHFMADDQRLKIIAALVRRGRTDALLKHAERCDSALLYFFVAWALLDQAPSE